MKNHNYLAVAVLAILMGAATLTNAQQSWLLNGNAPAPGQFFGTTTKTSLLFKMAGVERMRIDTNGCVGIGTMAPSSPLDLSNSGRSKTLNIKHNASGTSSNYANYTSASSTGTGATYAYYGTVSGTGNGARYGLFAQLSGTGSGNQYGTRISISNSGAGTHYGVYSVLSGSNSITKYGIYSSATGGSNNYAFYGIGRSYFSDNVGIGLTQPSAKLHVSNSVESKTASFRNDYSGNGTKSGIFNEVTNLGTGGRYGIYNAVSSPSTSTASAYGIYSKLEAGSGIAWGILSEGSNTSNADAYGIYATASSTGNANSRYGVRGYANSNNGAGVKSYGVYGSANGGGAISENYGVYGTASGGSTANYAGYFNGLTYTDELRVGATQEATGYIVSVDGKIICEELRVQERGDWPDYVFEASYQLPSLEEVEQHIKVKKHLPGVPSACEIEENGLLIGEMQRTMMEKIEELTLYVIELKKENKVLTERMAKLEVKD